jgi:hypothetical protein
MSALSMLVARPAVAARPRAVWAREPPDLEARLVAQVRAPVLLRRALARVAGRMVATSGWERLGSARPGDYAVERAGISAREFRDLAAVDAALGELPVLDAAFRAGEIGWTQLRLLCRVATAEDQPEWLALAARLTARELAREVRAVDRRAREPLSLDSERDDEKRVGVVLRLTPRARARWWSARQVANRVAGHVLSHGAFAEVLAAEVLSGVPLDGAGEAAGESTTHDEHDDEKVSDTGGPSPVPQRRGPPVSPLPCDPEVAALEQGLEDCDAFELDRRLRRAVDLEARGHARVASLLSDVVIWGLHRDLGYRSVDSYAEERLAMAPSRARALLRIERAARVCPPLREAFTKGRLSWVQAYALVPLLLEPAAGPYREGWVAHAQRITVRRLGDDVERALALGQFAPPPLEPDAEQSESDLDFDPDPAGLQTGANTRLEKECERLVFLAPPEVAQLFRAVLATVQRRLERIRGRPCNRSDALEAMLDHALATWRPKKRVRRDYLVFERDGWRCTAPGCTSYRHLHRHHIVFRSNRGSSRRSNLTTLCWWHHKVGIHQHVLRCTGVAPDGLRFELGLRSDGPPLAIYRSGDICGEPV